jgi:hypothetical protein
VSRTRADTTGRPGCYLPWPTREPCNWANFKVRASRLLGVVRSSCFEGATITQVGAWAATTTTNHCWRCCGRLHGAPAARCDQQNFINTTTPRRHRHEKRLRAVSRLRSGLLHLLLATLGSPSAALRNRSVTSTELSGKPAATCAYALKACAAELTR